MTYQANHQRLLNGNNAIKNIKKGGGMGNIIEIVITF